MEGAFPFVARFQAINDVVMVALKQTKTNTYLWGVPVDKLIEWVPPRGARDTIDEDAVFIPFKLPNEGIVSVHKLENTSTHKLRDLLDKLISHTPTFRWAKIKSIREIDKHVANSYEKNVKVALLAGELRERKLADDKGVSSGDANESSGGGKDSMEKWAALGQKLLEMKDANYALPFEKRFLIMPVDS